MVSYEAQINQYPTPYYSPSSPTSRKRKIIGATLVGGLIGMNAYYIPVDKDIFVQRAFEMKRDENYRQIETLKNIAQEVEKNKVSTESKMILQEMNLFEDVTDITNKCMQLENEISETNSVKNIKDRFIDSFDRCKKHMSIMDSPASDAYKAVRKNKFYWGIGIGSAIGLALGLMTSRD